MNNYHTAPPYRKIVKLLIRKITDLAIENKIGKAALYYNQNEKRKQ